MLAKRFESSFIFENVYFAKPLLDERVLAQDVDCSLAAVVLRQREWKRKGHRPQPSNTRISNSINEFINVRAYAVIEGRRRSAPAARTWITAWNAYALTDAFRGGCSVVEIGSQFKAIQHVASVATR